MSLENVAAHGVAHGVARYGRDLGVMAQEKRQGRDGYHGGYRTRRGASFGVRRREGVRRRRGVVGVEARGAERTPGHELMIPA